MRILIVDQEGTTRKMMETLIQKGKVHQIVGEADNGMKGLELINRKQPDLVITDINLPIMSGLEMIHNAKGRGIKPSFVIISKYSDFLHTRQAICSGVVDYLLKPVEPEEVEEMLVRLEGKFAQEKEANTLIRQSMIRGILTGELEFSVQNQKRLGKLCGLPLEGPFTLLGISAGKSSHPYLIDVLERIKKEHKEQSFYHLLSEIEGKDYCIYEGEAFKQFLGLLYRYDFRGLLKGKEVCLAAERMTSLYELRSSYKQITTYYEYQMVLGNSVVITKKRIQEYKGKECFYPKALENRLLRAVIQGESTTILADGRQFLEEIAKQKLYPYEIRNVYTKILTAIWTMIQEMEPVVYEQIQETHPMQKIAVAETVSQLETVFMDTLMKFINSRKENNVGLNTISLRAIAVIRDHYSENITLNEVADQLGITPEYLSFLFKKEVGDSFCSFVKKFRISHAKRLLRFSDKKVYEVSKELGYQDSRYFSRVFKQEVGLSPAEYRQMEGI